MILPRLFIENKVLSAFSVQICGLKNFQKPPEYKDVVLPERPKLRFIEKVPQYPPAVRPPKMQKRLRYMRGFEQVHNNLSLKQYGIVVSRLKFGHLDMIRMTIGRKMDTSRMFAIWRVDAPWQPITRKGQGHRMGSGKGAIDHYVTPIKPGRVIVELGGYCEFEEVKSFLHDLAMKMPFKAMAVSHDMMVKMKREEEESEKNNLNPYTMKYLIQNNMGGCQRWITPFDFLYFGKYM